MIQANNVTLRVGKKALFEDVNIKFTEGNCYGLIGANGAGKSTFLKILSGVLETTSGDVSITPGQRLSVLEQDHFKYDAYSAMDTVIMGNARLYEIMKESPATLRMANILNRLVHGSASTFNQQTNVSLRNKYTVLDISSLTGDLLIVGMFVVLDFVWDRAKENRTEEKAVFIDECWQLLSGAGETGTRLAGDFVLEIFKTIRGYGGSAVCASQDLNDFFHLDGGRFGKGIINNSKTKVILNLEDDEAARVQDALHLSDAEVMEITHFERGNGLISTNSNNIMVEFKASPLEKDLITTDRRELQELVERMRRQDKSGDDRD